MERIDTLLPASQRQQVIATTHRYINQAASLFDRKFELIPVRFDLKGRAAGVYQAANGVNVIRYNPYIFAKFFAQNLANTVPHEVAHYAADQIYGRGNRLFGPGKRIRPHGREWQNIMHKFGVRPARTFNFDISDLPQRSYSYLLYNCDCRKHQLGIRRHNRVVRKNAVYRCKKCAGELRPVV